ncbi:MAG: hypothetical protein OP8BY_0018 [Candidatus Saccharicenans subterraneus]|uniref:Uncharacterized protein n=1 Tax=Candidatus Saccharicenans subterraneus TaxID=2508984 RepID=A0A3E2BLM1_9BACT|nr:MAG: hypothetical protein OP8BY_0018 [Candidatus Saccharicenans subterraneum]
MWGGGEFEGPVVRSKLNPVEGPAIRLEAGQHPASVKG